MVTIQNFHAWKSGTMQLCQASADTRSNDPHRRERKFVLFVFRKEIIAFISKLMRLQQGWVVKGWTICELQKDVGEAKLINWRLINSQLYHYIIDHSMEKTIWANKVIFLYTNYFI